MKKQYLSFLILFLFFSNCSNSNNTLSNGGVLVEMGFVNSAITNSPLDSVMVRITGIYKNLLPVEGITPVFTDANGYFEIGVGSTENLYRDTIIFSKKGYVDTSFEVYPGIQKENINGYDTIRMRPE